MIRDGTILSLVASAWLLMVLAINPRLMLQDFPKDIQGMVPPKTEREKRTSVVLGVPLLVILFAIPLASTWSLKQSALAATSFAALAVHAFAVGFMFNLFDLLVLDWLIVCAITPKFLVVPGSEGAAGYKDYLFHVRGLLVGTGGGVVLALLVAAVVYAA
ncbi:MAG: hypothetical protein U0163_04330 [Gemmatimonadaceae bacterium]